MNGLFDRRRVLATGASAVVALLGACGSGTPPVPVGSSGASPTLTPTPAVTPTPTPTAAAAQPAIVVQVGDSIGAGYAADGYAAIEHIFSGTQAQVYNFSVPGRTMLTGFQSAPDTILPLYAAGRVNILVIQQGTNDIVGRNALPDSLYNDVLTPFVSLGRKAGFYVVVETLLPRSDSQWSAGYEGRRIAYNTLVRANAAADIVNDVAADPLIGDAAGSGTAYYADLLHPSLLGQQRLAAIDSSVLQPLLALVARVPF